MSTDDPGEAVTDEPARTDGNDSGAAASVRTADPGEAESVAAVLEGALLDCPPATVREAAARGDCLVAVDRRPVGACVLEPRDRGAHVVAIAVRRPRRDRGIGWALIERAAERGRLTATFRPAVRGFYEACGFRVEPVDRADDPAVAAGDEERLRGVRAPDR